MKKVVKIGVVGAGGRMRDVLKYLRAEDKDRQVVLRIAYDPFPPALEKLRDFDPEFEVASSEEAVFENKDVEWIFVGSWNCFHAAQIIRALDAGKHVFSEKPLATNLEDCLAIRAAVERSGNILSLGLVLRYSLHYAEIDRIIKENCLGKILSVELNETLHYNHGGYIFGNWRRLKRNAGSHILEKCCHDIDLVNWLLASLPITVASFGGRDFFLPANEHLMGEMGFGPTGREPYLAFDDPQRVSPFGEDTDIFDNQVAILKYANGVRASFHTNCHSAIPERRMVFVGTRGALRADLLTGELEYRQVGWEDRRVKIDTKSRDGHGGGDTIMVAALIRTMLFNDPPLASVDEGLCSAVVAFGIDEAAEKECVVNLAPTWTRIGVPIEGKLTTERCEARNESGPEAAAHPASCQL